MIPNPIHKVLSIFQSSEVRALLMGGQACVFYGGAEFGRETAYFDSHYAKIAALSDHERQGVIQATRQQP